MRTTTFDPTNPTARHPVAIMEANRKCERFKQKIVEAHAKAVAARMAEPIILVCDLSDRHARHLAESIYGMTSVAGWRDSLDGGVRAGAVFATVLARPCGSVRTWLIDQGEVDAAAELTPSEYPGNIVALVATSGDVHQFNADRC